MDDADLVRAARAGDRAALDVLMRRHRASVVRACRRLLRDAADAEDAAQEALVQALVGLPRLRDPARFGPWLHGIALNVSRRALEHERTRGGGLQVEVVRLRLDGGPVGEADREQRQTDSGDEQRPGPVVGDHPRQRRPAPPHEAAQERRPDRHRDEVEEEAEQRGGDDVRRRIARDRQQAQDDRVDDEGQAERGPHRGAAQAPPQPRPPHPLPHPRRK